VKISHVIGVDDAPFAREDRGDVAIAGAVFAGGRLDGVLSSRVRRDGVNSTAALAEMVRGSKFAAHLQAVLLEGIALAGFNVVDVRALSDALELPVVVVVKHAPDLAAVKAALLGRVRGGAAKWALVEKAGAPEKLAGVWVQRAGISAEDAAAVIAKFQVNGRLPEPLRVAHMIASVLSRRLRARARP
jgi:endonuclease V-like protein UPF0215 family